MKIQIGMWVRFIWKHVNWQGIVMDVRHEEGHPKASVAVPGYPTMLAVPSDQCIPVMANSWVI